jgi:hypothetical protein
MIRKNFVIVTVSTKCMILRTAKFDNLEFYDYDEPGLISQQIDGLQARFPGFYSQQRQTV